MTTLTDNDVKKIAHLARLHVETHEMTAYATQLTNILNFVEQMNSAETNHIEPLAHAFETNLRLRKDAITEPDQRDAFQAIAPKVEAGLYLVPKVIE